MACSSSAAVAWWSCWGLVMAGTLLGDGEQGKNTAPQSSGAVPMVPMSLMRGAVAGQGGTAADALAANRACLVCRIEASGATTLRAIAEALNARGIRTARGGAWYAATVGNLLARAG